MKPIASVSLHKAGSSVLDVYLSKLLLLNNFKIKNIAGESFNSSFDEEEYCINSMYAVKDNHYYGCFRGPYANKLPTLNDLKIIIQVRNPLDCLVSAYFSFTNSHILPPDTLKRKDFIERSKIILEQGIDKFCLNEINGYIERFKVIDSIVSKHPDFKLLYYEDMVLDNSNWQREIINFVGSDICYEDFQQNIGDMFSIPLNEDINVHKRKVLPGDHIDKLKLSTIKFCKTLISSNCDNSLIMNYV